MSWFCFLWLQRQDWMLLPGSLAQLLCEECWECISVVRSAGHHLCISTMVLFFLNWNYTDLTQEHEFSCDKITNSAMSLGFTWYRLHSGKYRIHCWGNVPGTESHLSIMKWRITTLCMVMSFQPLST